MKNQITFFNVALLGIIIWFFGSFITAITHTQSNITRIIFGICLLVGVIFLAISATKRE